jgi:predicted 2-oxoglutarate/Fe(II)-dependent dioxygenase YbiX
MPYIVNNQVVGHDPRDIERKPSYIEFFERIGNSVDNIQIIPNFLSEEEITYLLTHIDERRKNSFVSQKDNDGNPTAWIHNYECIVDAHDIQNRVKKEVVKKFGNENIKAMAGPNNYLNIARWDKGTKLTLHVDDLGYVAENHLPTLVYLNDDYEGGEISFATHPVTIKPKTGDLIMFPGNMHYAHEVKEVLSGTRYTLPIWFTVL